MPEGGADVSSPYRCDKCADALARHLHQTARDAGGCLEDTWDDEDDEIQESFCTESVVAIAWLGRCRCEAAQ